MEAFRTRQFLFSLFLGALLVCATSSASAQTYKAEGLNEAPPKELAAPIRAALSQTGIRVAGPSGPVCDLWLGKAVPDLLFTNAVSTASINPSTLTSSRKFEPVTALPDWDLVWLTSIASQKRSALVSAANTPIGMETFPVLAPSLTPVREMAIF